MIRYRVNSAILAVFGVMALVAASGCNNQASQPVKAPPPPLTLDQQIANVQHSTSVPEKYKAQVIAGLRNAAKAQASADSKKK